ncbi:enoyl-CoA hydratase/isomerase family protein [Nocardioides sp. Iso805N]|uniref:enoyl-CoA hydratase/isomerase family protein n=1 Tax=Nocardioides sp. Iso805N TaxID=1283287 RepID=UPI0003772941|nr:enoyl-CoA hydratase/isomerase family protein [Nocardioides sp. Iso805N]
MSDLVMISEPIPGVRQVTLRRPEAMNTLNTELVVALHDALDRIAVDRSARVVVLTGAGSAFCAGLDLNGYGDTERDADHGAVLGTLARQREISALPERINRLPQPVIAAINGPIAGGGLAIACASDIRLSVPGAPWAVGFIRAGFSACDIGLSWLLPRIVGTGNAHELMLTGRRFDSEEALRIGLVTSLHEPDELLPAALAKAEQIMLNPPASVELTKQGMWLNVETPSLRAGIELENRQQVITSLTEDRPEAARAFLEKRAPSYLHR